MTPKKYCKIYLSKNINVLFIAGTLTVYFYLKQNSDLLTNIGAMYNKFRVY